MRSISAQFESVGGPSQNPRVWNSPLDLRTIVTGLLVFVGYFFTTKAGGVGHGARNRSVDCRSARGHHRSGKRRRRWSAVFFEAKRTSNVAAQYLSNTVLLAAVLFLPARPQNSTSATCDKVVYSSLLQPFSSPPCGCLCSPSPNLIPL